MFNQKPIIVGLEIGTSKVCAAVGEFDPELSSLKIIGLGQACSRGVRKGEIVDPELAEEDIRAAIAQAEQMADVEVRSVVLGVTGSHLRAQNNRGLHPIFSADRVITEDDVQHVIKNAKVVNLPAQDVIVHTIRQHFFVDGQGGISNPVGMLGTKLEVEMHVMHGNQNRLQNAIRVVKGLQLEVEDIVFNGLASALALLTNEAKELGALVIDIGAGTTDYALYAQGVIRHTGVIAVGGDHLSNDIAIGLRVPLSRAEQLKIECGAALVDDECRGKTISIKNGDGTPLRTISLENLRTIMALRVEEIFQIVAEQLHEAGLLDYLRAGVFLCGGGARIPNVTTVAERIFQAPAQIGRANAINGLISTLDQPEFATAIGLLKFGSFKHKGDTYKASLSTGLKGTISQLFRRL